MPAAIVTQLPEASLPSQRTALIMVAFVLLIITFLLIVLVAPVDQPPAARTRTPCDARHRGAAHGEGGGGMSVDALGADARSQLIFQRHHSRRQARLANQKRAKLYDQVATFVMLGLVGLLVVVLVIVVGAILIEGVPQLTWSFMTTSSSLTQQGGGVGPQLFCTLYLMVLSLILTVPIGVGAALYLEEFARPSRFTEAVGFSVEALSSVPSIVFGTFGAAIFLLGLGMGYSILSGALTLTLLNLPLVVRVFQEALRSVPREYREASQALAAQPLETIRKLILPNALPGIITAVVLTAGRVIGETAPLTLTMGTSISPNAQYSVNPLSTGETLAVHIWVLKVAGVPGLRDADAVANGAAALLLIIVLALSLSATFFTIRLNQRMRGLR
jgi:phosphate transport system permease protein